MPSNWMRRLSEAGVETPFFTGTSVTSPVLSSNGTIYVGSGTHLYAFAPDKSIKPGFPVNTAGTVTKPTIGGDGTIYIVANVAPKFGYVYAIRPDGSLKPGWTFNPQLIVSAVAAPYVTAPVMSADNSRVYVAAREGSIYAFRATKDRSTGSANLVASLTHRLVSTPAQSTPAPTIKRFML